MPTELDALVQFFGGEFTAPAVGIARSPSAVDDCYRGHRHLEAVHLRILVSLSGACSGRRYVPMSSHVEVARLHCNPWQHVDGKNGLQPCPASLQATHVACCEKSHTSVPQHGPVMHEKGCPRSPQHVPAAQVWDVGAQTVPQVPQLFSSLSRSAQ
jgi:hypothetical protein